MSSKLQGLTALITNVVFPHLKIPHSPEEFARALASYYKKWGLRAESLASGMDSPSLNTPSSRRFLLMITTPLPSSTREMGLREGQPTSSLLLQGLDESPLFKWGVLAPPTAHQGCSPEPMRGKMNALEGNPSRAGRSQLRAQLQGRWVAQGHPPSLENAV